MPFDQTKWNRFANGGTVGGLALDVSIALGSIHNALSKLSGASGVDITSELASIEKARRDLWEAFESITGYTAS